MQNCVQSFMQRKLKKNKQVYEAKCTIEDKVKSSFDWT